MFFFNSSFSDRNSKYFKNTNVKSSVGVMISGKVTGTPNLINSKPIIVGIDMIKHDITKLLRMMIYFIIFLLNNFL